MLHDQEHSLVARCHADHHEHSSQEVAFSGSDETWTLLFK